MKILGKSLDLLGPPLSGHGGLTSALATTGTKVALFPSGGALPGDPGREGAYKTMISVKKSCKSP